MRKRDKALREMMDAAQVRASRGPWRSPEDRKAAEQRTEREVHEILAALEAGRPLPDHLHRRSEPATPEEQAERAEAAHILAERRRQIEEARAALAEAREEE